MRAIPIGTVFDNNDASILVLEIVYFILIIKLCNGQVKQDTLLSRLFIKFPLILDRGLIA